MRISHHLSSLCSCAVAASLFIASSNAVFGQDATLVAWWELSETDDSALVADSSGNEQEGFFEGFTDPNVDGSPFGQASYPNGVGSGAYFDGIDSAVAIDPIDPPVYSDWVNNFSVVAWINA